MTAEIVFHEIKEGRLKLDDKFEVSENAWRTGGAHAHGSAMFLASKASVRIEDLLRGLIIQSGNDAAITLAEGHRGHGGQFRRADEQARRRTRPGAFDLHQRLGQERSARARDRARNGAARRPYHRATIPIYYHYFGEKEFTWNKIRQLNRNPLLTMDIGADGLKTGDIAGERLRPGRLGGAERAAADRRRQRPEDRRRPRRGSRASC